MLAPPEEAIFTSKEDLIQSLRSHVIKEGYMICVRDSRPSGYTRFRCDRGGKPKKRYVEGIDVKHRSTSCVDRSIINYYVLLRTMLNEALPGCTSRKTIATSNVADTELKRCRMYIQEANSDK